MISAPKGISSKVKVYVTKSKSEVEGRLTVTGHQQIPCSYINQLHAEFGTLAESRAEKT